MACGKGDDLVVSTIEKHIASNEKHLCLLSDCGFKGRDKFIVGGCVHDSESLADYARSVLEVLNVGIVLGIGRVHQGGEQCIGWHQLASHLQTFRQKCAAEHTHSSGIATRTAQSVDEPQPDRIAANRENNRN